MLLILFLFLPVFARPVKCDTALRCSIASQRNRGPAPFHRLTSNKRFEPVFSTVIMAVCSLFNRKLLLTDLIPVHLLYCGQTVMLGCNHTSFEWTRAVRHIYGIIRHMQGLYTSITDHYIECTCAPFLPSRKKLKC